MLAFLTVVALLTGLDFTRADSSSDSHCCTTDKADRRVPADVTRQDQSPPPEPNPVAGPNSVAGTWTIDFAAMPDGPLSPVDWVIETGTDIPGYNNEEQAYTNRTKNVRVENGALVIEAHRESYGAGANLRHYTSGRITTAGIRDLQYGELQVRAKMPRQANGIWPAIWMLPTNQIHRTGIDPGQIDYAKLYQLNGEIDIVELYGGAMPGRIESTIHTYHSLLRGRDEFAHSAPLDDASEAFHDYGIRWSDQEITFLLDGKPHYTYKKTSADPRDWPFDQPFHLLLNVAVGGEWAQSGGISVDGGAPPVRMEVQSISYTPQH